MKDLKRGLRIGIIDIESTGLRADYGYCLCVCIKEVLPGSLEGKTHTIRIDDPRNPNPNSDRWVIKETFKLMNQFDLLVGWYSSQFDFPFLNARAIKYRMKPAKKQYRRDLKFVASSNFKIRNNRLATWDEFLFGKNSKTRITPDFFNGAIRGEKKALDYVVKHCEIDVRETERVYKAMLPFMGEKLKK